MARLTTIAAMSVVAVAAPQLRAQSPACPSSTTATLAAGLGQSDRVDMTASPIQFGGRGLDINGSFERSFGSLCVVTSGRGGRKTLTPATPGSSSLERLTDGELSITALRAFRAEPSAARALAFGAELHGEVAVTTHAYADPEGTVSTYRLGLLSLGPAVRWRQSLLGGTAVVQLASPVLSLVDHPYTAGTSALRVQTASLGSLRGLQGLVSYALPPVHGLSLRATYRASGLWFDDVRPVRSLSQTLSIGIATSLGSRR
jgi:hypothetical protein